LAADVAADPDLVIGESDFTACRRDKVGRFLENCEKKRIAA